MISLVKVSNWDYTETLRLKKIAPERSDSVSSCQWHLLLLSFLLGFLHRCEKQYRHLSRFLPSMTPQLAIRDKGMSLVEALK